MSDGGSPRACAACGSPLDGDQRYCLQCGERAAPRSGQLAALLERARAASAASAANAAASAAAGAATSGEAVPSAPGAPPLTGAAPTLPSRARRPGRAALASDALVARVGALRLPSRRVSAVLLLAFLGFGVLLGNAAGSRVDYSLADSKGPLKVVVPPSA
ncbi:MAG TPA: hypothetical protein VMB05_00405, partial [Solirubrobacteraceae bacterium]|nr:hypothetical protein [Solirubrobacteraceae bacterium]